MPYPMGDFQEADKDTSLNVMLRDTSWEQEIKTRGVLGTQGRGRGTAQDMKVNVNTGHSGKRCRWRREKANK